MAEMREKLMHFFDIGDGTENYVLLGDGISSLTEEFNPENETKHYIHQSSGTANVKSYAPSMSVEKEYIKDEELQKQIMEFHAKRMDLNTEMGKAEKDTNAITALNNELNALYSQVVSNPKMIAFEAAKAEMDGILESINFIVTSAANGDDPMTCPETAPHTCGGSCSTCGGCH